MWVFEIHTGRFAQTRAGWASCYGYSGHDADRNRPEAIAHVDHGPIPRGYWRIGPPDCTAAPGPHGPFVLPLTPEPGTETYGRTGFLIHGDSIEHPGEASKGCIVVPRAMREIVAASGDHRLEVV